MLRRRRRRRLRIGTGLGTGRVDLLAHVRRGTGLHSTGLGARAHARRRRSVSRRALWPALLRSRNALSRQGAGRASCECLASWSLQIYDTKCKVAMPFSLDTSISNEQRDEMANAPAQSFAPSRERGGPPCAPWWGSAPTPTPFANVHGHRLFAHATAQ